MDICTPRTWNVCESERWENKKNEKKEKDGEHTQSTVHRHTQMWNEKGKLIVEHPFIACFITMYVCFFLFIKNRKKIVFGLSLSIYSTFSIFFVVSFVELAVVVAVNEFDKEKNRWLAPIQKEKIKKYM